MYADLSPKGTVDAGIRELIGEINAREGLVTTSSCAGRVSVFLEGKKKRRIGRGRRGGERGKRSDGGGGGGVGGTEKKKAGGAGDDDDVVVAAAPAEEGVDAGEGGVLPSHPFAVDEESIIAAAAESEEAPRGVDEGGGGGGHEGTEYGEVDDSSDDHDDDHDDDDDTGVRTVAGVGGKGGGGRWLFVSHDPMETHGRLDSEPNIVAALLGMEEPIFDGREGSSAEEMSGGGSRLIHFKFEPMVCRICFPSCPVLMYPPFCSSCNC